MGISGCVRVAFAVVCLLSGFASATDAATFYVSPSGNDAAPGTSSSPFRTVGRGISGLRAGDTLILRGGTYVEEIQWYGGPSGTSWSAPITLQAQPGEVPVVRPPAGAGFALSMRASGTGTGDAPRYIIFNGITFDGSNVQHDVVKITAWDPRFDPADGPAQFIRFQNGRITGAITDSGTHQGLMLTWGSIGVELLNMEVDNIGGGGSPNSQCIYGAASNLLIDGSNIHHCGGSGGYCVSNLNSYPGLQVSNHTIRNSRMHDCAGGGVNVGEGSGHLIYNNLIYNNGLDGIAIAFESCGNCVAVYNNTVYGNGRYGIFIESVYPGIVVQNNVAHGNRAGNFRAEPSFVVASNNSFDGTDPGFMNPVAGDFRLKDSSRLINAGLSISAVRTDRDGVPRPQGGVYDIGAHEFGGAADSSIGPPPPPTNVRIVLN